MPNAMREYKRLREWIRMHFERRLRAYGRRGDRKVGRVRLPRGQ
jgi:hypothetical protein